MSLLNFTARNYLLPLIIFLVALLYFANVVGQSWSRSFLISVLIALPVALIVKFIECMVRYK